MIVVVVWLLGAVLIGSIAGKRGRSGGGWFLLAILISPLLALLFLLASKDLSRQVPAQLVSAPPTDLAHLRSGRRATIEGDGEFRFPIVGESHYQDVLEGIVGGRDEGGARLLVAAVLRPEPDNAYDLSAVAVSVGGETVGYLSRDVAPLFSQALAAGRFAEATCEASINGGWKRGADEGDFGVRLNARMPFRLRDQELPEPLPKAAQPPGAHVSLNTILAGIALALAVVIAAVYLWSLRQGQAVEQTTAESPAADSLKPVGSPLPVSPAPSPASATSKITPKPKPADPNAPMVLIPPGVQ